MPRYYAMLHHWEMNGPPVYISVAAYLGLVKKDNKPNKPQAVDHDENERNLMALMADLSGSGGVFHG